MYPNPSRVGLEVTAEIRPATGGDIERMREIEVDAGERFRIIGLDLIADGEPQLTRSSEPELPPVWRGPLSSVAKLSVMICDAVDR